MKESKKEEKYNNILNKNIEYVIIQNEETKEIIVEFTQEYVDIIKPYIVRVKEKNS